MTLDEIIAKYGTHELDIDCIRHEGNKSIIYAYCHEHDVDGEFMVNHNLEISGLFRVLEKQLEDDDMLFHIAIIFKNDDESYEIMCGYNEDRVRFCVESDLDVKELSEEEYEREIQQ